jgi:hypothetical protein
MPGHFNMSFSNSMYSTSDSSRNNSMFSSTPMTVLSSQADLGLGNFNDGAGDIIGTGNLPQNFVPEEFLSDSIFADAFKGGEFDI